MRREDRVLILDMIDEAENVALFIAGRVRKDLDTDRMLSHALVRAIEVMGEAAGKVSSETRAATPEIPWKTIVAMRNRLIHGYATIDPDVARRASARRSTHHREHTDQAALSGGKLRASAAELSWSTSREPAPRGRAAGVPEISR